MLASGLTVALVVTMSDGVHAPSASAAPQETPAVLERADQTSALVTARLTGRKVTITGLTSETSEYVALPSGQVEATVHAGIVRVRRGDGWVPVDLTMRRDSGDGSIAPAVHPSDLRLSGARDGGTEELAAVGLGADRLSVGWTGALPEPVLEGDKATYVDARPGVDLVVRATRAGMETFAVVKSRAAVAEVARLTLPITGANAAGTRRDAHGNMSIQDAGGRVIAHSPAPEMWDARVDDRGVPVNRTPVDSGSVRRAARSGVQPGVELSLTPDQQWLTDPARRFPVTIDPQINPVSTTFDTYVKNGDTSENGGANDLQLGYLPDGVTRSLLRWNTTALVGKQISSATAYFWNWWSPSCTAKSWQLWTVGPVAEGVLWGNQPAWSTNETSSTATKGFSTSCTDGWVSIPATSFFQRAATAGDTRADMGIRAASETDAASFKQFRSRNADDSAQVPYAVVNYNSYPVVGARSTSPSSPCTTGTSRPYLASKTPALKAVVTDADGGNVTGQFEWSTTAGTVIATVTTAAAASGSTLSTTVPAAAFTEGSSYRWRVRGGDGTTFSAWSGYCEFTVDTTAPAAAPAVSSADYPAGAWSKAAGQAGSFTIAAGGITDVSSYLYGLDVNPPATTVNPAALGGSATVSLTPPTDGPHILSVRSRDRAGNLSAVSSYQFAVGSAGVTSPKDGDRTAREVVLSASGPSTATGVRFQYRRSDVDAWTDVPVAAVRRRSDGAAVTWPAPLSAELVWKVTDTVADNPMLKIRAVLTSATGETGSTAVRLVVDRLAARAATENIGPGSLNLVTGDFRLSGADAEFFGMGLTRTAASRDPALGRQGGPAPIFGPQWAWGYASGSISGAWLRKPTATTVEMLSAGGTSLRFAQVAGGGWEPEPGSADLALGYDAAADRFTLTQVTSGDVTVFGKVSGGPVTYVAISSGSPAQNSTVLYDHEAVTGTDGVIRTRLRRIVAPTTAVAAATCLTAPATAGCRVLELSYASVTTATSAAFGDFTGQVSQIHQWLTGPGQSAGTSATVARYAYDQAGNLREVWDPRLSPLLKTGYTYDAAGRVATQTEPGQLPWTFAYGTVSALATAGAGMLLSVSRPTLQPGTTDVVNGAGSTSVVYDVPVSRAEGGPYDLRAADVAAWGQQRQPQTALAIFPPDAVPAGNVGRGTLATGGYTRAAVHYLDGSGNAVDQAEPGGHISVTEYDNVGSVTRMLTAANRVLALGTDTAAVTQLTQLGLQPLPAAQRATMLSSAQSYSADGLRLLESTGPVHLVTLATALPGSGGLPTQPAGSEIAARAHSVFTYDQGRPADGSATVAHLATREANGIQTAGYAADGDVRLSDTRYDWTLGVATESISDPAGLAVTEKSFYDRQGRLIEKRMPASTGNDAGTTITSYYTATGAAPCGGRPEWADLECRTGPKTTITGGGDNPEELITRASTYARSGELASVTETANGVTRVTSWVYDALDREISSSTTGGVGEPVSTRTTSYDPVSGLVISTSTGSAARVASSGAATGALLTGYDVLGRMTSYTDATGAGTTYQYDALDRTTLVRDSTGASTGYGYDPAKDPRGVLTSTTDSVAGTFTAGYDANGALVSQTMPGGVTQQTTVDQVGMPVARSYTAADGAVILADEIDVDYEGQWLEQSNFTVRTFTNDARGRLTQVDDVSGNVCTRRTYGFGAAAGQNTNRVSKTTAVGVPEEGCPQAGGTTETHAYDSADRLVDAGYEYDELGRTVATPQGLAVEYYADNQLRRQTLNGARMTWTVDPDSRNVSAVAESGTEGVWSTTATTVNHYRAGSDRPDWIEENAAGGGGVTRNVAGADGDFTATTSASGDLRLHLTDMHGDVRVVLDPATSVAEVLSSDEFGVQPEDTTGERYGWLGNQQRSQDALGGTMLMGARVYDPASGRFLQTDPVDGGSANAYDYCSSAPTGCVDYSGLGECSFWGTVCGRVYNNSVRTMYAASIAKYSGGSCQVWDPIKHYTHFYAKCKKKTTLKPRQNSKKQGLKDADGGTFAYTTWWYLWYFMEYHEYIKVRDHQDLSCSGGSQGARPHCHM